MKEKKRLIPFYAISGYYSTSGNDLGLAGTIKHVLKIIADFVFEFWIWILLVIILFLIIFFWIRRKKKSSKTEDLSLPALILANNIEEL
ncbi:MAG: hypothetical protein NTW79_02795 [Candidatus Berkelbacteria bacterium]|nr:hypothetical protein [Candidatus Berkelbacteria bacterium]